MVLMVESSLQDKNISIGFNKANTNNLMCLHYNSVTVVTYLSTKKYLKV